MGPAEAAFLSEVLRLVPKTIECLFPNCRLIVCCMSFSETLTSVAALISPSVDHLRLFVGELTLASFDRLHDFLAMRRPRLHTLEFVLDKELQPTQLAECEETFVRILSLFSNTLERVNITTWFSTEKVLRFIHRMPNLVALMFDTFGEIFPDVRRLPYLFAPPYDDSEGNFGGLQNVAFHGSEQKLHDLFLRQLNCSAITSFRWSICGATIAFDHLTYALAAACPRLVQLELMNCIPIQSDEDVQSLPLADFSSLKTLLTCKHLTIIVIYICKFSIDMPQLTDLLSNRRTWKEIAIYTEDPMSLNVLPLFAKYCPNLTSLCININASTAAGPIPDIEPGLSFSNLNLINFKHSLEDDSNGRLIDIAQFLFRICEYPPDIYGLTYRLWNLVCLHMASLYIKKNKMAGSGLSGELRAYLRQLRQTRRKLSEQDWGPELGEGWCRLLDGEIPLD